MSTMEYRRLGRAGIKVSVLSFGSLVTFKNQVDVDLAPGPEEAGAAIVFLGSTDEEERATSDIVFLGEAAHDRAGVAVAGGFDFNGDTINDFMIGAEQVNRTDPDNPVLVGTGKALALGRAGE